MRRYNFGATILGTVAAAFIAASGGDALANVTDYSWVPQDQKEFLSSPEYIQTVALSGAPMQIWEALEHGERVECLACIPIVAPLMYSENAQNREIAAWWLRRRMIGVFGPGQVYSQTLKTLATDPSPARRAYAASAVGEFLVAAGIPALAQSLTHDNDPTVRASAAAALGRINDDGGGALSQGIGDADANVRVAALTAAGRINSFTDVVSPTRALSDSSALVRRRAAMLLDQMRATDAGPALVQVAQKDSDVEVRIAACHALGSIGDTGAQGALTKIAANDSSSLVRDMAAIALLEL
jgi:HEAT repeat protein